MPHMRILESVGCASLLAAALVAFPTISRADATSFSPGVPPSTYSSLAAGWGNPDVLPGNQQNAGGQSLAVDIFSPTTGVTGNIKIPIVHETINPDQTPTAVPEPSALFLVGTALLGIGYSIRNRIFRRT